MKIRETLTETDLTNLLTGSIVGIFPTMILQDDGAMYSKAWELCLDYYVVHSAHKTISPAFAYLIDNLSDVGSNSANALMGKMVRGKFIDKWKSIYKSLITDSYDPLKNYEYTEKKDGTNVEDSSGTKGSIKSGNNKDTIKYGSIDDTVTNEGISRTTQTNDNTNDGIFGFNSESAVGDSTSNTISTETVIGSVDSNVTKSNNKKSGEDIKNYNIQESTNDTTKDNSTYTIDETFKKDGREGIAADMLDRELSFRQKNIFFDIVFRDIDSITTIQIYN